MTHQKNPVESLRADISQIIHNPNLHISEMVTRIVNLFDTHHDQILTEMLESVGEDEIVPDFFGMTTAHDKSSERRTIRNQEKARIRSILLAKKKEV